MKEYADFKTNSTIKKVKMSISMLKKCPLTGFKGNCYELYAQFFLMFTLDTLHVV